MLRFDFEQEQRRGEKSRETVVRTSEAAISHPEERASLDKTLCGRLRSGKLV